MKSGKVLLFSEKQKQCLMKLLGLLHLCWDYLVDKQ